MWVYIWKERLPSTYQEVEYIQSSWSQKIDTWITPNDATYWFECKFNITNTSWDWWIMMACTQSVNHWRFGLWGYSTSNFQTWIYWTADNITTITPATWVDYTAIVNYNWDGKTSINWTVRSTLSPQSSMTYSTAWTIFCYSYGTNSYARYGSFKLYYMKIWHWTTLERELIPCYRKSDNVIWMYDTVNNQFYTNSWSWTFTKWQDINYVEHELKNAYIGEYRLPGANTIAYYEFDNNLNDSVNSNNLSLLTGTVTYWTDSWWGKYAYFNKNTWSEHKILSPNIDVGTVTVMYWWQPKQVFSSWNPITVAYTLNDNSIIVATVRSVDFWATTWFTATADTWYHLAITCEWWVRKFYVNWTYYAQDSYSLSWTQATKLTINNAWDTNSSSFANNNYISELIIEDKARTAQEISDYYTITKWNYWL